LARASKAAGGDPRGTTNDDTKLIATKPCQERIVGDYSRKPNSYLTQKFITTHVS
jgi:hypothetical protein